MKIKTLLAGFAAAVAFAGPAAAADAICYNCPPEWADWGTMLKSIKADLKLNVPHDNKNSGQTLSHLIADKANPVADIAYFGVTFGIKASEAGVIAPYKPAVLRRDPGRPQGARRQLVHHPLRHHRLLRQRRRAARRAGAEVLEGPPQARVRGPRGLSRPDRAAVGYAAAIAVNLALGGTTSDCGPGIQYFKDLKKNQPDRAAADLVRARALGRDPDHVRLRLQHLRAKYKDKCNCRVRDSAGRHHRAFPT